MTDLAIDPIRVSLEPFVGRRAIAVDWKTRSVDQKGYRGGIGVLKLEEGKIYLSVNSVSNEGEDIIRKLRIVEGFEVQVYKDGDASSPSVEARYLF